MNAISMKSKISKTTDPHSHNDASIQIKANITVPATASSPVNITNKK